MQDRLIKGSFNKAKSFTLQPRRESSESAAHMFDMAYQAAMTARTHPNHKTPTTARMATCASQPQPDWTVLRELDFSDALVDWFGPTRTGRGEPSTRLAGLDLDRALAFAG